MARRPSGGSIRPSRTTLGAADVGFEMKGIITLQRLLQTRGFKTQVSLMTSSKTRTDRPFWGWGLRVTEPGSRSWTPTGWWGRRPQGPGWCVFLGTVMGAGVGGHRSETGVRNRRWPPSWHSSTAAVPKSSPCPQTALSPSPLSCEQSQRMCATSAAGPLVLTSPVHAMTKDSPGRGNLGNPADHAGDHSRSVNDNSELAAPDRVSGGSGAPAGPSPSPVAALSPCSLAG